MLYNPRVNFPDSATLILSPNPNPAMEQCTCTPTADPQRSTNYKIEPKEMLRYV